MSPLAEAPMQRERATTIYEKSKTGRRAAVLPDAGVPGAPIEGLSPANALRAPGPPRGPRAGARPPLQPAEPAELRPRFGLLPARLLHDEAQPAADRAGRGAARPRPRPPGAGPRAR